MAKLILPNISVTINNPPVWDQQPNPIFVQGSPGSSFDMNDISSDPDSDALSYSLNTGAISLPTGVTWNISTGTLDYDGVGAVDTTSGHVCTADDGQDTTNSNTFNIIIQAVASAFGFPRISIHHIGGRTETDAWRDIAFHDRLAVANDLTFNFATADAGHVAQSVSDIKAINPNVRVHEYRNYIGLLNASAVDQARKQYLVDNFVTPLISPNGTDGDGMAREPDGTILSGWPDKEDVQSTDFPNLFASQLPAVYTAMEEYNEWYTGQFATTFDDIYYDIWRWYGRYSDRIGDFNRDGLPYSESDEPSNDYEDFDGTGTINSSIARTKTAINTAIQVAAQSDRGEDIRILGELGWLDHFDGGRADNDVILPADVPASMISITDGGNLTNWAKILGLEPTGVIRASGNFERGYKYAQRMVEALDTSTATNTVRLWCHIELLTGLWDEMAYCCGAATLAGAYVEMFLSSSRRNPAQIDEFFGSDLSLLSVTQRVSNMNWMGLPIGTHPTHGQAFSEGVNGGIIESGVYGMEFDNAFLLVNPAGNGNQTINIPPNGPYTRIDGGQRSDNDGTSVGSTLQIDNSRALFLVK